MQLTQHFTLEEMIRSDAATRLNITEQFKPNQLIANNLTALCAYVLEPLRAKANTFIHISSGYRCERANRAIGGAPNSQHVQGEAADTTAQGLTVQAWYQLIKTSGVPFDQLIQEFNTWVHVSYNPVGIQRGECLRAVKENGRTVYKKD